MGMKSIITVLACAMVIGIFSSGCASTNVSKISAPTGALSKTIVATPDVEKGDKISGSAEVVKILGGLIIVGDTKYADGVAYSTTVEKQETGVIASIVALFGGESNERAKAAAAYKACQDNNADLILCPSYVLDEKNYFVFSKTRCTVSGFKGVIKGIKELETKDYLEMGLMNSLKLKQ